jgi:two-component system LytT family sensor kinase
LRPLPEKDPYIVEIIIETPIKSIVKTIGLRLLSYILLGTLLRITITYIFDHIYTPRPITFNGLISTIILNTLIMELVRITNNHLNKTVKWSDKPLKRFSLQFLLNIPIILIITTIADFWTGYYVFEAPEYLNWNWSVIIYDFCIVYAVVLIFSTLYICIDLIIYLVNEWRYSLVLTEQLKRESLDYQLLALKNQVNPHFLFNSLNTLSSLIYENQDMAAEYVRKLSNVYRRVLEVIPNEKVILKEELKTLESYIYLVETRFVGQLFVKIEIHQQMQEMYILPLTLQMLIENAINHNIVSTSNPLHVKLYIKKDYLVVENKRKLKSSILNSTKLGLNNLKSRYAHLSENPFYIENTSGSFKVFIPLLKKGEL